MNTGSQLQIITTKLGILSRNSTLCNLSLKASNFILARYLERFQSFSTSINNKKSQQKKKASYIIGNLLCGDTSAINTIVESPFKRDSNSLSANFTNYLHTHSCDLSEMSQLKRVELLADKYQPKECKFPTSYGYIAGLEWGNPEAQNKILCVHGWLDNAGSFEPLIPFILDYENNKEDYHIIAMDMPGVGHSSHLPSGATYANLIVVAEMRRIAQQLNWTRFNLIGHSMGSHFSFIYSCLYPSQVLSMISIDLVSPMTRPARNSHITLASSIEDHLKYEYEHEDDPTTNINTTVYSETDALKRLMDAHSNALTKESALLLMKRGAKRFGVGYTFTRDLRWRFASPEMRLDDEGMLEFMSVPFRVKTMLIVADSSPYKKPQDILQKYVDLYRKNCPLFEYVDMKGTHHLHMNTPEPVAVEINKFLKMARSQDPQNSLTKSNL